MQKFTYSDLLSNLQRFDPWLVGLGLKPHPNDRIHKAFDVLRFAEHATRRGRESGEYSHLKPEHLFPLIEALEAHEILRAFECESSDLLRTALKRALSGPTQAANENDKNRDGRNIWFELALAAQWKLLGANVELGEPDLHLERENTLILVACKRPAREESVRANIRSAIGQLNANLGSFSKETLGVAAISLNCVLNPGTKYWSGDVEQLGDLLHRLMSQYLRHWRSAEADPRICAILFHATTPGNFWKKVDITHVTYSVAAPLKNSSWGSEVFERHMREMKARYL